MSTAENSPADFERRLQASLPRLRAYLRCMVFAPGDIERLLKDIAETGRDRFAVYDPSRPFDAWLLGVARNRLRQHFRAQPGRGAALSTETLQQLEALASQAYEQAGDMQETLGACLTKLAKPDGELIAQRYTPGVTNSIVAKKQKVHELIISQALNRVLAQLLVCMTRGASGGTSGGRTAEEAGGGHD